MLINSRMDFIHLILLWMVMLPLLMDLGVSASYYKGCWPVNLRNRHFFFNPGKYNPELLSSALCQERCGKYEQTYSGVYNDKTCFCANELPTSSAVDDANCSEKCAGNATMLCGGVKHVRVFLSSQRLSGLELTADITKVAEAPVTANLTYAVKEGLNVEFQVDFGDGAGFTENSASGLESRRFYLPGKYSVTVRADDKDSNTKMLQDVAGIVLESGPEDLEIVCDPLMVTHDKSSCAVTVWKGSNLKIQVDIPDQTSSITVNPIADPKVEFTGIWRSNPNGTVNQASEKRIILLVGTAFSQAGKIYGWRVHLKNAGTVKFMIMKPKCNTGSYCPLSNTCTVSCTAGVGCSSPASSFCMQQSSCSGTCKPFKKSYGNGDIPVDGYEITHIEDQTFGTDGENWVALDSPVDVTPGDIMALEQDGPGLVSVVDSTQEEDIIMAHTTPSVGTSYSSGSGLQGYHIVQPYVSYGSKILLNYMFAKATGITPLTVTITNNNGFGSPAVNNTNINIVEGIDFVIIEGPLLVKLGESPSYSLAPHTGSDVSYAWETSNGQKAAGKTFTYAFTELGWFNLSVVATNPASSKENLTEVLVVNAESFELASKPIIGATFKSDLTDVTTDDTVTFTVDLESGAAVTVVVDFKDGSPTQKLEADPPGSKWLSPWVLKHDFINGCQCGVTATFSNPAGTQDLTVNVLVKVGLGNLIFPLPSYKYYVFQPPSHIDPLYFTTKSGIWPTDPKIEIAWGDNTPKYYKDDLPRSLPGIKWQYDDTGIYDISVKVENIMGSKIFKHKAIVIDRIIGPKISLSYPSAPINQPYNITFSLFRGDQGNHTLIHWDFGDGKPETVTERQGTGINGKDTLPVTYISLGTKTVTIKATTPLNDSVSASVSFEVISGIDEPSVVATSNGDVTLGDPTKFTLQYNFEPMPSNAFIKIDWYGDGSLISDPIPFSITTKGGTQEIAHTYAKDGRFNVKMIIYNEASHVETFFEAGVYQDFVNLRAEVTFESDVDTPNPPRLKGIKDLGQVFPLDKTLYFKLIDDNNAFGTNYTMRLKEGPDDVFNFAEENDFPYNFTIHGVYKLEITVKNNFHSTVATTTINIVKRVKGLEVTEHNKYIFPGQDKLINITLGSYDEDTCVYVDWKGQNRQHVYGNNPSACNERSSYPFVRYEGSMDFLFANMAKHKYAQEGQFEASVEARNAYGFAKETIRLTISYDQCAAPQVNIYNEEHLVQLAKEYKKSAVIRMFGQAKIDCPISSQNVKSWRLEEVDSTGQRIKDANLLGIETKRAELFITPNKLPLGIYKAVYSMTMTGETLSKPVASEPAYSYIKVVPTKLEGSMVHGGLTERTIGTEQILLLEPLTWSIDPDVPPLAPQGLTVVRWTCEALEGGDSTPCLQNLIEGAQTQNIDGSKLILEGKYNISAYLEKDTRKVLATVILEVLGSFAPNVFIRCKRGTPCYKRNDGIMALESSKLSLECNCTTCKDGEEMYEWKFFMKDYRWPSGWRPIRKPHLVRSTLSSNGIFSKEFTIQNDLFEYRGTKLDVITAQCLVYDGPNVGKGTMKIYINQPPANGNCIVTPDSARATIENFKQWTVYCYKWKDEDGIKEYQVTSVFSPYELEKQITSYISPNQGFLEQVILPVGPAYRNYVQDIYVTIRDNLNAFTKIKASEVQVLPPVLDNFDNYLDDALNNEKSNFFDVFEEGDQKSISELSSSISVLMAMDTNQSRIEYASKYDAPDNQLNTGYGPGDQNRPTAFAPAPSFVSDEARFEYEQKRSLRTKMKTKMINYALDLPANDITSIQQLSSMFAEVSSVPTEISVEVQTKMLETATKMIEKLQDPVLMKNVPMEELEQAVKNLMSTVGSMMDASAMSGLHPTQEDLEKTKKEPEWLEYDTSVSSIGDNTDVSRARSYDEAMRIHTLNVHKKLAKERAEKVSDEIKNFMQKSASMFESFSNTGETLEAEGYRLKNKMEKTLVRDILGKEFKLKGTEASITLPRNISDLFPDGNVLLNDSVTVQMTLVTNVADRFGEDAMKLLPPDARTHYVLITIYDENGNILLLRDDIQLMKVLVPNDPNAPQNEKKIIKPFVNKLNRFQIHKTEIKLPKSALHLEFQVNPGVQYLVVVNHQTRPDPVLNQIEFVYAMPSSVPSDPRKFKPFEIIIDNNMIANRTGEWFVGVIQRKSSYINTPLPTNSKIAERYLLNSGNFEDYNLTMWISGCFSNGHGKKQWRNDQCSVEPQSTQDLTHCLCTSTAKVAGGFAIVLNTIDWGFVFANADFLSNPTLYTTQILVTFLFIIGFLLARRKDKRDILKCGLTPMVDNDPNDNYYYEIIVKTGLRPNAGTDSKVYMIMGSIDEEYPVRFLNDSKRDIFKRGMTNGFLMAVPKRLKPINYLRVWHDNSGEGKFKSWYLSYMTIKDLQLGHKEVFKASRWLAVEEGDGQVDRIIPVASIEQLLLFRDQFKERSKRDMMDGHLWFSVIAKPPPSKFTCIERVACCYCLFYLTMLANAMFYNTDGKESESSIDAGAFSMSLDQVVTGVLSTLIIFPLNFLLVFLFRKSAPRKVKENKWQVSQATSENLLESGASMKHEDVLRVIAMKKSKKKSFQLLWHFRVVAWTLFAIITLGSAAMVTFYGISFGDETCRRWIASLLFSFLTSVFVTQPLKVILIALFISLIMKRPVSDDDEYDEFDDGITIGKQDVYLHTRRECSVQPTPQQSQGARLLAKIRAKRAKEVKMWAVIREIGLYLIFLWIMSIISHHNRSVQNFRYKNIMHRTFIEGLNTEMHYEKIQSKEDFWLWAKTGFVSNIQAASHYNKFPPLRLRGYINDKASRILGHATLRQHRVKPARCSIVRSFKPTIDECNVKYSMDNEEKDNFDRGWRKFNTTLQGSSLEYQYSDADTLYGYPYWGNHAIYSGGGYVVHLKGTREHLFELIEKLEAEKWIDRYTRTAFVEFTVYNPQVNLFSVNTMLTEFDTTNGAIVSYRFEPAMLLASSEDSDVFYVILEIIYLIFITAFLFIELKRMYNLRTRYFIVFWNLVEISIIICSLAGLAVYFYRMNETSKLTKQFKASKGNDYIKFQHVGFWNEILAYIIGIVAFLVILKLLRLLRFNKRVSILGVTLAMSKKSFLSFGILAFIVFFAFVQLFFLLYMNIDESFSSLTETMVTAVLMTMGKFNIYNMIMADPFLTQIIMFSFVVSVTFIIVNMFISILNDTFKTIRRRELRTSNDYEIINFMMDRFQKYLGAQMCTLKGFEDHDEDAKFDNLKKEQKETENTDALPEQFDHLLDAMVSAYKNYAKYFGRRPEPFVYKRSKKFPFCAPLSTKLELRLKPEQSAASTPMSILSLSSSPRSGNSISSSPMAEYPMISSHQVGKPKRSPQTGNPKKPPQLEKPMTSLLQVGKPMTSPPQAGMPMISPPHAVKPMTSPPQAVKPMTSPPQAGKPITSDPPAGKPITSPPPAGKPMTSPPQAERLITSPPQTAKPTSPPQTAKPTPSQTAKPTTSPPQPAKPTSPPQTAKPTTSPPQTAKPTSPPQTAKPTSPPQTAKPTFPPQPAKPTSPPQPAKPTSPPQTAKPTSPPQTAKPTSPPQTAKPTTSQVAKPTSPRQTGKPVGSSFLKGNGGDWNNF